MVSGMGYELTKIDDLKALFDGIEKVLQDKGVKYTKACGKLYTSMEVERFNGRPLFVELEIPKGKQKPVALNYYMERSSGSIYSLEQFKALL